MGSKMDAIIANVNKKVKEEIISKGLASYNYDKIPFTSPRMNYCTYGGVPVGKMTEFFGAEHGGKTTSALDIVANFQALERQTAENSAHYMPKDVLFCDCENTLDELWARKLNVDVDTMYDLHPKGQSAEEIFNLIEDTIKTEEFGLIVLDSLASMVSDDELKKSYDDKSFGGVSGPLSRFSKKMEQFCAKYNCTFVGLNQVRDEVNSTWGGYKTPGGRCWKHLCIARFEFRKGKYLDEKGVELPNNTPNPSGNKVELNMVKNKTCPANRKTGFYTLSYLNGIDYLADLVEVGQQLGVIHKESEKSSWYTIDGVENKVQGQYGVKKYLEDNVDILKSIEDIINEKIRQY